MQFYSSSSSKNKNCSEFRHHMFQYLSTNKPSCHLPLGSNVTEVLPPPPPLPASTTKTTCATGKKCARASKLGKKDAPATPGPTAEFPFPRHLLMPSLDTLGLEGFGGIIKGVNPQYIKYSLNTSQSAPIPHITRVSKLDLRGIQTLLV
jgi:hypothetical protein